MKTHGRMAWCCVQSGHREQYAVPRALNQVGLLDRLITDVWMPPGSAVARLATGRPGRRLRDSFHPEVPRARVSAFTGRSLAREASVRLRGLNDSERVLAHNAWWAALVSRELRKGAARSCSHVFSYCYNAREVFSTACALGLSPVLGQIDPGPVEDVIVSDLVRRWPAYRSAFQPGEEEYYVSWREECRLAEFIVANSEWSRTALLQAGIEGGKIVVCPLVYTPPAESLGWTKSYPDAFTRERPLRVLFLGQCILRKGIAEAIASAQALVDRPVEFTFVGNTDIADFPGHFGAARIRHLPRVSRAECHAFYREADVFLFPTHSDGFGLTQLEAQAWKLPIIASRFCAEVVRPGETGWVLPEVAGEGIKQVIEEILADPSSLSRFSGNIQPWSFELDDLARTLGALGRQTAPTR